MIFHRYAGYRQPSSSKVLGDPAEAEFTQMVMDEYGWKPPSPASRFDILPLLLQAHPSQAPQVNTGCSVTASQP